ncbi:hypothetical protein D3C71_1080880 [compost metagenome]
MDSAFSRSRISPNRKSASRRICQKFSRISGAPKRYSAPKVPSRAYTAKKATSVLEMDHNTALNATSCISEPMKISRKCVDRLVKVLMSSLMRWSGLSMSPPAPIS